MFIQSIVKAKENRRSFRTQVRSHPGGGCPGKQGKERSRAGGGTGRWGGPIADLDTGR